VLQRAWQESVSESSSMFRKGRFPSLCMWLVLSTVFRPKIPSSLGPKRAYSCHSAAQSYERCPIDIFKGPESRPLILPLQRIVSLDVLAVIKA
jgi:hypothetical protein